MGAELGSEWGRMVGRADHFMPGSRPRDRPHRGWQKARPRRGMLGIIGRRRLQAVDIPRLAAMRAGPVRAGHGSPVFRRGTYSTQFWTVAAVGG
jgi:hypothetical protein